LITPDKLEPFERLARYWRAREANRARNGLDPLPDHTVVFLEGEHEVRAQDMRAITQFFDETITFVRGREALTRIAAEIRREHGFE
jgi:hypothetical protein